MEFSLSLGAFTYAAAFRRSEWNPGVFSLLGVVLQAGENSAI